MSIAKEISQKANIKYEKRSFKPPKPEKFDMKLGDSTWHESRNKTLPRNRDGHIVSPRYTPEHQTGYLAAWREWIKANPDQTKWPDWLRGDIQLMRANGKRSKKKSNESTCSGETDELG